MKSQTFRFVDQVDDSIRKLTKLIISKRNGDSHEASAITNRIEHGQAHLETPHPKNPWTLQWKGLNLYSRGPGPQISHF